MSCQEAKFASVLAPKHYPPLEFSLSVNDTSLHVIAHDEIHRVILNFFHFLTPISNPLANPISSTFRIYGNSSFSSPPLLSIQEKSLNWPPRQKEKFILCTLTPLCITSVSGLYRVRLQEPVIFLPAYKLAYSSFSPQELTP